MTDNATTIGLPVALGWNVVDLVRDHRLRDVRRAVAALVGAGVALTTVAYSLSPLVQALTRWWLD